MSCNAVAGMIGEYEIISGHIAWFTYKVTPFILQLFRFFSLLDICINMEDKWRWSSSTGYDIIVPGDCHFSKAI
jgi:hypothetical protein